MAWVLQGPHRYISKELMTASYNLGLDNLTSIGFQDASEVGTEVEQDILPEWVIEATPPQGAAVVPTDAAFSWAGQMHFSRDGVVFRGWHQGTGATQQVGAITDQGRITLGITPPGASNVVVWHNLARDKRGALDVLDGVFRTPVAPLQAGQFQLMEGDLIGNASGGGVITGDFDGLVDSERGIVAWGVAGLGDGDDDGQPVRADQLTYNAVYLQYVPINEALLGVGTTLLPLDGRVPGYHEGESIVIHNTSEVVLPNPVALDTPYSLGRQRVAHVALRDATGKRLPGALYELDPNPGTVRLLPDADLDGFVQPITAYPRIEDEIAVIRADLSGRLDLAEGVSHDYPADGTTLVSGKLRLGDKFARAYNIMDRTTWQGAWDATAAGSETTAGFDDTTYPIHTTNRGAIKERWAAVFLNTTHVRIFGERVGQVLDNVPIAADIEAINPQTGTPYWTIPKEGWGGGWANGNVLLWETDACGGPVWVARAVLPGSSDVLDDQAVIALRSDVDPTATET